MKILRKVKILCGLLALIIAVILPIACDVKQGIVEQPEKTTQSEFIQKHVAFADARIRSISNVKYVREVVLINLSDEKNMPSSIIFDGTTFFDDGSYNDRKNGDGIYTSATKFNHDENIPYNQNMIMKSVMNGVIVDKQFEHEDELQKAISDYSEIVRSKSGPTFSINCDLEFGVGGCKADQWGWCDNCCFSYSNCNGGIEWSLW